MKFMTDFYPKHIEKENKRAPYASFAGGNGVGRGAIEGLEDGN